MNKLLLIPTFFIVVSVYAQEKEILIFRNATQVEGMMRLQEVTAKSSKLYGGQNKLRIKTIEKIKTLARELDGDAVLITLDNFTATPINNINIVGDVYRFSTESPNEETDSLNVRKDYYTELKKLKELLDEGIITQEEFDNEKIELLKSN